MTRPVCVFICLVLIVALFGADSHKATSQSASPTPCPTTSAVPATAATPPTSATLDSTAAATPDFSDLDAFATFAAQLAQSPHQTVKSADGKLALLIPPGALPADTPLSKLKFTTLNPTTAPTIDCAQPLLAYQLNPDGLHFITPTVAILTIDAPKDDKLPMLWSVSGQTTEPLSPILYQIDATTHKLVITVPIAHFSNFVAEGYLAVSAVIFNGGQQSHAVNDPFDITGDLTTYLYTSPGAPVTWVFNPFWSADKPVSPPKVNLDAENKLGTYTYTQQFQCTADSNGAPADIRFGAHVLYDSPKWGEMEIWIVDSAFTTCQLLAVELDVTFKRPVTTYHLIASDPDGDPLSYEWSNSNEENGGHPCGGWAASGDTAAWTHPDTELPGACLKEDVHPGTITVKVSDGHGAQQTVQWTQGSAPGILKINGK